MKVGFIIFVSSYPECKNLSEAKTLKSPNAKMSREKLMKMVGTVRIGGNDNVKRKKVAHKTTTTDDKRLQSNLKRIGVNASYNRGT